MLAALMTASDHLPVVADYQLPAILDVIAGEVPLVLNLGQPFSLEITIRNGAPVDMQLGADELDYMLTISGSFFGADSEGEVLARSDGSTHSFELDTSSVGMKSGTIIVTSDGQGIAGGVVEIPVVYEVIVGLPSDYSGNGAVDQADLDLVLTSWGKPFDEIPPTWLWAMPTEGIVDQAELDVVLTSWGAGEAHALGVQPAVDVPEPTTMGLLLCGLLAVCRPRRVQLTRSLPARSLFTFMGS